MGTNRRLVEIDVRPGDPAKAEGDIRGGMMGAKIERRSHIFEREEADHYVEPPWVSARLFEVERFPGTVLDPACGWGRILESAKAAGYATFGSDLIDRGYGCMADFLLDPLPLSPPFSIVTNPPFDRMEEFAKRALASQAQKVAVVCPVRRLPAARWLQQTPLRTIYFLTPRPSMPPGHHIVSGGKVGGGTVDFAWLIWERNYAGEAVVRWLTRVCPS